MRRPSPILPTLALVAVLAAAGGPGLSQAQEARVLEVSRAVGTAMATALARVRAGDWRAADSAALPAGPVGRDIVAWYRLRDGEGVAFEDYLEFFARRPDWPQIDTLRRAAETAMPPGLPPEEVLAFFAGRMPQTGAGVLRLVEAHEALNHTGDAEALAVLAWRTLSMNAEAERALLDRYGSLLAPHHPARLDEMLWREADTAVARMLGRVDEGWQRLAEARLALRGRVPGVDAKIEAVPEPLAGDGGLAHARFDWRVGMGRWEDAIALMLERSTSPEALGRPEKWAGLRRQFARSRMRDGAALEAYALASRHFLVDGADFADLEWLSGYLALRYLDDPELALFHFDRFAAAVQTPISRGRAGYWRGRAYAAMGDDEAAQAAWQDGSGYQTSFYGLLSAEAAGLDLDPTLTGREEFPPLAGSVLAESSVLQAALLLQEGGEPWRAEQFLRHLATVLGREEVGMLGQLLTEMGEPHLALRMAKAAAGRGVVVPAAYFPLSEQLDGNLPVERALALAVARRESEFDPVVVSPAGARGLMQLMPATARDVSADLGLPYDRDGLTADPAYNARLGTTYLAGLIDAFGPAPVLVAVGYNAGPGRAIDWVAARGDPREPGIDVIDWIEHIPFRETRNYVMRVTESVIVYRARLTGETGPVAMLDYLRNG